MPDGLRRSYSIATRLAPGQMESDGDNLDIEFHVRLIPGGAMSERLRSLENGASVTLHGPLGACSYSATSLDQPILMIGSGTGLAPLVSIASHAVSVGHVGHIWLFHGASSPAGLYLGSELRAMERAVPSFHYVPCADISDDPNVLEGSPLTQALSRFPDLSGWRVYTCGHPALVNSARKQTFLSGASMAAISSDSFADQSVK